MKEKLKFISDTPTNILDLQDKEIQRLIDNGNSNVARPAARMALIKILYEVMGYNLTNDILLMLAAEPTAKLCLATAGGGKTTAANIQIVAEKLFRQVNGKKLEGSKVLCLMYNKHNIQPFQDKHNQIVNKIKLANVKNLDLDSNLRVATMHSYANMWCNEYSVETGLMRAKPLDENEAISIMQMAIKVASKKHLELLNTSVDSSATTLYSLYEYKAETLLDFSELKNTDKFIDTGMSIEALIDVFAIFDSSKKRKHRYVYSDMLTSFYHLLRDNEPIRKKIQEYYQYVVADEVQDFTPLMFNILRLLVSDGTPLMCIGDEDQSIYGFRGANIYNALDFKEMFNDAQTFTLFYNRRCKSNIVEAAKMIIDTNSMRFDKSILATKDGGNVELIPYNTVEGQVMNICNKVKDYSTQELNNTVICCRDKMMTMYIAQELADRGIMSHVSKGYHAYTHELYRHVLDVLLILARPRDIIAQLNLYKCLPIKREELYAILKYDSKTKKFSDDRGMIHFAQIDYGTFSTRKNFKDALNELVELSKVVLTDPLNTYFSRVFELINRWFWYTKKSYNKNEVVDNIFEQKVINLFNSDKTYKELNNYVLDQKAKYQKFFDGSMGINISTFHSLKGLEYNNVFMMYLDNDLFPNFPLIDSKPYPPETKLMLKEAETRLCYVAMTRARNNLYMYYPVGNPSRYINILNHQDMIDVSVEEEQSIGTLMNTFDTDLDQLSTSSVIRSIRPVPVAVLLEDEDDEPLVSGSVAVHQADVMQSVEIEDSDEDDLALLDKQSADLSDDDDDDDLILTNLKVQEELESLEHKVADIQSVQDNIISTIKMGEIPVSAKSKNAVPVSHNVFKGTFGKKLISNF